MGRPDLLEQAAHLEGTMEGSARALYRSVQSFAQHEDWLQIWPGHGAGSACGKGISAVPHSTLGYERRFNWAFGVASEDEFVRAVLERQPDPPVYFATMKRLNRGGPPAGDRAPRPPRIDDGQLLPTLDAGAVVVDTRPARDHAARSLPGTPASRSSGAFSPGPAGWCPTMSTCSC
jgi:hydroxyacylglutathione hydrolase